MTLPARPALRYLGGKWRLAPWIIGQFPEHRIYVEPFGGAASVLLQKPRAYSEVYNDLDDEVVNFFRVLRDPTQYLELQRLVALTPYARSEFNAAYERCEDPVERARRMVVRSFMGFGNISARIDRTTGFRSNSNRSGTTPAHDWANLPPEYPLLHRRLSGVTIEQRPALELIAQHNDPATLLYVDPPYVHETRGAAGGGRAGGSVPPSAGYVHEMSADDHEALLDALLASGAMVVLSGYPHPVYERRLKGWRRLERQALADGARARTEVVWSNDAAAQSGGLFGSAA